MLKAYIPFDYLTLNQLVSDMVRDSLENNDVECICPDTSWGFEEMRRGICESDVYITFSHAQYCFTTFNPAMEADYAINAGVPVVVIKVYPNEIYLGQNEIKPDKNIAVYDFRETNSFDSLGEFIRNHIENCKKSDVSIIQAKLDKPYTGDDPYIFVSYAHKDKNKVFGVIRSMQEQGYRIWYDDGINPASEWDENIAAHIKGCSYLIAFISQNYIDSDNCKDEIKYARDLKKERLLVYLEDTELPAGMAMRLMRLQAIHKYTYSSESDFYDKLYSAHGIEVCRQRETSQC